VVGGVCLLLLLVGFAILLPSLSRHPVSQVQAEEADPSALRSRLESARRALLDGKRHIACRELDIALRERNRWPEALTAKEARDLNQLHRQADLLVRLLALPLEEIVRQGKLVRDQEEWKTHFADYQGRTVVFDDVIRRDLEGRPVLGSHVIEVDNELVRVELEDLRVFGDLPLDDGARMIFGARLARCSREARGGWVIRFEPDSGVLLTEPGVAEVSGLELDDDTRSTVERQRRWLEK